jgi:hypothetical protein
VAGKIVADIIEAPAGRISLNVANVTVASINALGLFTSTGNLLITQANSIATAAIENGAVTTAKIAPSAIVGTVSQSGGVPTGAIIERGSNANGEFVKYADGTLICGVLLSGNSGGAVWVFPAVFSGVPYVTGIATQSGAPRVINAADASTTQVTLWAWNVASTLRSETTRNIAFGRWF